MLPEIIAIWEKVCVKSEASLTSRPTIRDGTNEKQIGIRMGRRPNLKSEALSIGTILGVEIIANLCSKPLKKCYMYLH